MEDVKREAKRRKIELLILPTATANRTFDIHRLIVMLLMLLVFAYDILSLTPPRLQAPAEPYAEAVDEIARKIISKHPNPRDTDPGS